MLIFSYVWRACVRKVLNVAQKQKMRWKIWDSQTREVFGHKLSQVVTNCLKLSQFVIICHKSPQVNKSHHKLSRVVKCQRKLSKVETICHKLIQFIKRILPSSASTKLEAEIALFSITPATRTHR